MKRVAATIAIIVALAVTMQSRTRPTQARLATGDVPVERIASIASDTITDAVDQNAVTLRGFNKRASDGKETFFVTNNLNHRISSVRLLMRYTMLDGVMLHERTVTVPVTLAPGETQLVSVKSFDVQRLFYYYGGPKPRKSATPFKVAVRLQGYDIPVGY